MNDYVLPSKELLESSEKLEEKRYYHLAKLLLKKDLNDNLIIPIGINENNDKYYIDLKDTAGVFIGGETGSGKSVFLNALIINLLFKNTPEDIKFAFIDPNKIELNQYEDIPHLYNNIGYDKYDIYKLLLSLKEEKFKRVNLIQEGHDKNEFSHIIVIIDEAIELLKEKEMTDILKELLTVGKDIGIHIILSTSAYFEDAINKELLDLFPYVLTFDLASLDQANFINIKDSNLLKVTGEAYIKTTGSLEKIQTPYISDDEIKRVVEFIKAQKN